MKRKEEKKIWISEILDNNEHHLAKQIARHDERRFSKKIGNELFGSPIFSFFSTAITDRIKLWSLVADQSVS